MFTFETGKNVPGDAKLCLSSYFLMTQNCLSDIGTWNWPESISMFRDFVDLPSCATRCREYARSIARRVQSIRESFTDARSSHCNIWGLHCTVWDVHRTIFILYAAFRLFFEEQNMQISHWTHCTIWDLHCTLHSMGLTLHVAEYEIHIARIGAEQGFGATIC